MTELPWWGDRLVDDPAGPVLVNDSGTIVGWRVGQVVVDGAEVTDTMELQWEIDEVAERRHCGPLELSVRHSIDHTWTIRILLHNTGESAVQVDRVVLDVATGDEWTPWAACDGADAMVAVLPHQRPGVPDDVSALTDRSSGAPRSGDGRILGFTVLQGELLREDDRLVISDIALAPGAQYVLRIRGDWYDSAVALAGLRPGAVPALEWLEIEEVFQLSHPDQGLAQWRPVPDGFDMTLREQEQSTEIEGYGPGQVVVDFEGPHGHLRTWCGFAPRRDDLILDFIARAEKRWPVGRQGIRVDSVAEGVILQSQAGGYTRTGRLRHDDIVDALDGLVQRMSDEGPLAARLLAGHALQTGDVDLAERASLCLAAIGDHAWRLVATLPVLAARTMAEMYDPPPHLEEFSPDPEVGTPLAERPPHLELQLSHAEWRGQPDRIDPSRVLSDADRVAAALAAAVVTPEKRWAAMDRIGARWGMGLHGRRLAPLDLVGEARLLALASLFDEFRPPQPNGWVRDWEELRAVQARRLRGELWLRRADADPAVAEALAWLTLVSD